MDHKSVVLKNVSQDRLRAAMHAFRRYETTNKAKFVAPRLEHFQSLSPQQKSTLSSSPHPFLDKINRVACAIEVNGVLASNVADSAPELMQDLGEDNASALPSNEVDKDIARATIRQLYRDFSAEGARERGLCHEIVVRDMANSFRGGIVEHRRRVLVPGAGLMRLPLALQDAGYDVEANEVSHAHLLTSTFILTHPELDCKYEIYPWAMSFSNHVNAEDQFASVQVPDIFPRRQVHNGVNTGDGVFTGEALKINMADFVQEYSQAHYEGSFDAVATLFFIDTAPNFLDYVSTIRHCLTTGGIWINVGPLLWNCYENGPAGRGEGDDDEDLACKIRQGLALVPHGESKVNKLEFANDEVLALLEASGFEIEINDSYVGEAGFVADPKGMLQSLYRLSHWVARKV